MNRSTGLLATTLAALTYVVLPTPAHAQSGADEAVRSGLIDQALEARRNGDHAHALELAQRANQIRMTGTLQGFIAREQVDLGHIADALGSTELCVRDGENEPPSRARDTILNWCRAQLPQLRTRVGRVVVVPGSRPAGLHVSVGGHELSAAVLEVPYVVTPGAVVVEAVAPGYRAFRREVTVSAGQSVRVDVPLEADPNAGAGGPVAGSGAGPTPPAGPSGPVVVRPGGASRTVINPLGPVLMGVGAAGLITAAITWVVSDGVYSSAMQNAPADGNATATQINTLDTVTTVSLIGGGALVVLGGVLTFALMRTERAPEAAAPALSFSLTPRSIGLGGTF